MNSDLGLVCSNKTILVINKIIIVHMGFQLRLLGNSFKTIQKKITIDALNHFAKPFVGGGGGWGEGGRQYSSCLFELNYTEQDIKLTLDIQ